MWAGSTIGWVPRSLPSRTKASCRLLASCTTGPVVDDHDAETLIRRPPSTEGAASRPHDGHAATLGAGPASAGRLSVR